MAKQTPGEDAGEEVQRDWEHLINEVIPNVLANTAKEAFIKNFDNEGFSGTNGSGQ